MTDDQSIARSGCETLVEREYLPHAEGSLIEAVVDAVAEAAGVDPLDLPPMYEFIDPDAVDKLFRRPQTRKMDQYLSFRFDEWVVSIHADGVIRVRDVIYPIEL